MSKHADNGSQETGVPITQLPGYPVILSIVIVNWNTREYLLGALRSIYEAPPHVTFEVVVADNDSSDSSAAAVDAAFPQVNLLANQENYGYARGNNQGIGASKGKYVLLLNPDVIVPPDGLDRAVSILERRSDVGALGAKLISPDGSVQRSVRGYPTPWAVLCEATGLSRVFPRSVFFASYRMGWFDYGSEAEVDQPMGTFLLMPRRAFDEVGLLDEQFPIFFNEVDWCYRARKAGWKILYSPEIAITHFGGGSTQQVSAKMAWESRRGLLDFYRKHYRSLAFAPIYWITAAASWLHAAWTARRRKQ